MADTVFNLDLKISDARHAVAYRLSVHKATASHVCNGSANASVWRARGEGEMRALRGFIRVYSLSSSRVTCLCDNQFVGEVLSTDKHGSKDLRLEQRSILGRGKAVKHSKRSVSSLNVVFINYQDMVGVVGPRARAMMHASCVHASCVHATRNSQHAEKVFM